MSDVLAPEELPQEKDPAGRFHITAAPSLTPAEDYITKSTVGPFVDTGAPTGEYFDRASGTVKGRGRIYLSFDTVRELADVAGFFDNLASKPSDELLQDEYNRGYDDALKENLVEHFRDLAAELVAAADRLAGGVGSPDASTGEDVAASDAPSASDDGTSDPAGSDPADGSDAVAESGADEAAPVAAQSRGQGNGNGRNRRPARIPGGSGDGGASFRI